MSSRSKDDGPNVSSWKSLLRQRLKALAHALAERAKRIEQRRELQKTRQEQLALKQAQEGYRVLAANMRSERLRKIEWIVQQAKETNEKTAFSDFFRSVRQKEDGLIQYLNYMM